MFTRDSTVPYCLLCQSEVVETIGQEDPPLHLWEKYESFQAVRKRILAINSDHINKQRKASEAEEFDDESNPTVFLQNRWGNKMQVGRSKDGWLMILFADNNRIKLARLENNMNYYTVFLLPEWTEFSSTHIIPCKIAEEILKKWLDGVDIEREVIFNN